MASKMNKYIFFTEDRRKIDEVFSGNEILNRMQLLNISLEETYSLADLQKYDFSPVEYIFSTWSMPKLTVKQIKEHFPSLKAVFYAAGTVKYFAKPFFECGVDVFSADYANAISVSEFVTAEILLATKGYFQAQRMYKKRRFIAGRRCAMQHVGNYDAVIGIIGAGKIGCEVINKLRNYNLKILMCDPAISKNQAEIMGCEKVELCDVFSRCDVISSHLPDINETVNILNYDLFSRMKDFSTFINTGRGRQVEERGLIKALSNNNTLCAVLDVTSREPMWFFSRFYTMDNIFISPHIAGSINHEQRRMAEYMLDAYEDYIHGNITKYIVDPKKVDNMT